MAELFENGAISLLCNRIPNWADLCIKHVPAGSVSSPVAIVIALFINGLFKDHLEISFAESATLILVNFIEESESIIHPQLFREEFVEQLCFLFMTHVLSVGNTLFWVIEDNMFHDVKVERLKGSSGHCGLFVCNVAFTISASNALLIENVDKLLPEIVAGSAIASELFECFLDITDLIK